LPDPLKIEALMEAFHGAYKRRYGHDHQEAVEIVNLRVTSVGKTARPALSQSGAPSPGTADVVRRDVFFGGAWHSAPIMRREALGPAASLAGPAIIDEFGTTSIIPPSWVAYALAGGAIEIRRSPEQGK